MPPPGGPAPERHEADRTEREHARQWDTEALFDPPVRPNGEVYDEAASAAIEKTVQEIVDAYFPGGRPRR